MIGYWSLDETSGAVAHDGSGSGHDGTVYGAPARTAAVIGDGLRFNGVATNDYVRLPNSPAMDSVQEGNYTLAAWVKPLSVPPGTGGDNNAGYGVIMKEGMHIGLKYAGTGQFSIGHYLASNVWRSANTMTVTTGRFYHVAGTVDKTNGTMRLYLDGMLQSTNSWTGNTPAREFGTATWKIGLAWPNMPTWACLAHAVIDEVRIYDRVLTQPEVHAIMEANPPPIVTVAYPANLSYTTNVTVSVGGKAYDADGVAGVTVNGIAAASTNNYTNWNRGVAGLAAGTNVLTVVATDTAANAETNRVLVLYATGAFDGNGDGVPDSWQIANFGFGFRTNAAAGREADPDGDRMPNWSEQIAGTDPTNGLSRLALEGIAGQGAGAGVTVRWQSVTGKRYAGERSTNLPATASFHGMFTNLPGQPGWTEYVDTNAPGAGPFFYRIGVE